MSVILQLGKNNIVLVDYLPVTHLHVPTCLLRSVIEPNSPAAKWPTGLFSVFVCFTFVVFYLDQVFGNS